MPMDVDVKRYINPRDFDVMLSDIHDTDIGFICEILGKPNLSKATEALVNPLNCIMYGMNSRIFCMVPVSRGTMDPIWIPILYDTGAPVTYLTKEVFMELGVLNPHDDRMYATLNGRKMVVYMSKNHFHNVNVLGHDFMKAVGAKTIVDYKECNAIIEY